MPLLLACMIACYTNTKHGIIERTRTRRSSKMQVIFELGQTPVSRAVYSTTKPRPDMMSFTGMLEKHAYGLSFQCYLFAHGTGTLSLGYHGAARGWTCMTIPDPS